MAADSSSGAPVGGVVHAEQDGSLVALDGVEDPVIVRQHFGGRGFPFCERSERGVLRTGVPQRKGEKDGTIATSGWFPWKNIEQEAECASKQSTAIRDTASGFAQIPAV